MAIMGYKTHAMYHAFRADVRAVEYTCMVNPGADTACAIS